MMAPYPQTRKAWEHHGTPWSSCQGNLGHIPSPRAFVACMASGALQVLDHGRQCGVERYRGVGLGGAGWEEAELAGSEWLDVGMAVSGSEEAG